jgi:CHAT domain-containing protein/tetratricopeptide (TPR) repeat protein
VTPAPRSAETRRSSRPSVARLARTCLYALLLITPPAALAQEQGSGSATAPTAAEAAQLARQAGEYLNQGRYVEAERLFRRALKSREIALGRDDPDTLNTAHNLGTALRGLHRYAEAEALYRRTLQTMERVLGPDHPDTLNTVYQLAHNYDDQSRYAEAEPLFRRALETRTRVLGGDHPDTLESADDLAHNYRQQDRYAEAEPLLQRTFQTRERLLGRDHRDTLGAANNLASLYLDQGRYDLAEPIYQRNLETTDRTLGRDHPDALRAANNLAVLYQSQGRYGDAEVLYQRALETSERVLGRDHVSTLRWANNLASLYEFQGRYTEAEPLFRRAFETAERLLGRDSPDTLRPANNLARVYRALGRNAEAEQLFRRALDTSERLRGRDHRDTLIAASDLAILYRMQGRRAEAEPLFQRVFEARERVLGRDNPDALQSASLLVVARLEQGDTAGSALSPARLLVEGLRQRAAMGGEGQQGRAQREREAPGARSGFALFADASWAAAAHDAAPEAMLRSEVFTALQDALTGPADRSIAQQAARRYASGRNPELATLIREREQLENEWSRQGDRLAMSSGNGPDNAGEAPAIRTRLEAVQSRITAIDARLRAEAPDYFALIRPTPLDVAAAQALLGPEDALLLIVPSQFGTHVVALTRDTINWRRSDWTAERVRAAVERLRRDVGPDAMSTANGRFAFDRGTAHQLYQQLVEPVAAQLTGKTRLYVVAGGSLAALPFSVLVAAPPEGADDDPVALRATHWLGDDFALVNIPSIQSLSLLRRLPPPTDAGQGFFGIGDPVLGPPVADAGGGNPGTSGGNVRSGAGGAAPQPSTLFRQGRTRDGGVVVNREALLRLPSLSGSLRELEEVRLALGAPQSSLLLAGRATEANVRGTDLSHVRILVFSTHGLTMAQGAHFGAGESGLVLTPPAVARDGDDGFLGASEVATLRLDADWVILSACNTATGDGVANAGLGGLARSFFYAGARNLLASHWNVSDAVAPELIRHTLELERSGVSRAEALQQAMHRIRMDSTHDAVESWAHPFFWAPFVLVGDGGH